MLMIIVVPTRGGRRVRYLAYQNTTFLPWTFQIFPLQIRYFIVVEELIGASFFHLISLREKADKQKFLLEDTMWTTFSNKNWITET